MRSILRSLVVLVAAGCFGVMAQADVFHVTYTGGAWVANSVASGDYVSVTGRQSSNSDAYAAKNGAGVDLVVSGSAPLSLGLSTNYKSLSALTNNSGFMWGANTAGGVDYLSFLGGWNRSPLVSGNYLSVSSNTNGNNNVYASKASGGIDWINFSNGTSWAPQTLFSTPSVYVDLAPQYGSNGQMWAVTSTGAIKRIDFSGGWVETPIVSGNYLSVCNSGSNGNAYAARADGGIDYIYNAGGWGASSLFASSTVYTDLASDLQGNLGGNGFLFATAVPEPSTLVAVVVGVGSLLTFRRRQR
jgi:hypothetical protein